VPEQQKQRSLKQLLFDTVEGFEDLAVLLWFYERHDVDAADADTVAKGAGVPRDEAEAALDRLVFRGILEVAAGGPKRFRSTGDRAMREIAELIASEYRTSSGQVMRLLTENAIERVKTAALRTFAECFRIRGPK
jgi:hypothetical protein